MIMANSIKSSVPILVGLTLIGIVGTLGSESTETSSDLFNQLDDPTLDWSKAEEMMLNVADPKNTMIGIFSVKELLTLSDISEDKCTIKELQRRIGYCLPEYVANNQGVITFARHYWAELSSICPKAVYRLFSDLMEGFKAEWANIFTLTLYNNPRSIRRINFDQKLLAESCSREYIMWNLAYFIKENSKNSEQFEETDWTRLTDVRREMQEKCAYNTKRVIEAGKLPRPKPGQRVTEILKEKSPFMLVGKEIMETFKKTLRGDLNRQ